MTSEEAMEAAESVGAVRRVSRVCESQWTLNTGLDATISMSDMDDRHVALGFIGNDAYFKADLTIVDVLAIRDELTRIVADIMREDKTIRCPACGYTWDDAQFHNDHRNCRRYPFFPDESGKSHAINK